MIGFSKAIAGELAPFGVERAVSVGDVLFRAGAESFDFFVVLEGSVDLTAHGTTRKMRPGHLVYLAAGVPHALKARNDASVLVTMLVERE